MSTARCAVRLTRRYAAGPAEVWRALTEPDSIERWLGPAGGTHVAGRREREQGPGRARGEGQRRLSSPEPAPLAELDEWLERYRGFWTNRLDALETEIKRRRRQG